MDDRNDPDRPTDGHSWRNGITWCFGSYGYAYRFDCHRNLCRPHHIGHKDEAIAVVSLK